MPPTRYNKSTDYLTTKMESITINNKKMGSNTSIPYITSPISPSSSGTSSTSPKSSRQLDEIANSRRIAGHLFSVTLKKSQTLTVRTFGFSVSDGDEIHPGIYVKAVIPGSPADGKLKPLDRILQVI